MNAQAPYHSRIACGSLIVSCLLSIAGISQAAPIEIRISTPEEIGFLNGVEPAFPRPIWESFIGFENSDRPTSDYWTREGSLWRFPNATEAVSPPSLDPTVAVSIATSILDYRRNVDFTVNVQQVGNEFVIDAMEIVPFLQTDEFRFPEDMPKEFVHPVGALPAGEYQVTVRLFGIQPEFALSDPSFNWFPQYDFDAIDFQKFVADPMGYDLPDGFSRYAITEHMSFTVVPEPSSIALSLFGLGIVTSYLRQRSSIVNR